MSAAVTMMHSHSSISSPYPSPLDLLSSSPSSLPTSPRPSSPHNPPPLTPHHPPPLPSPLLPSSPSSLPSPPLPTSPNHPRSPPPPPPPPQGSPCTMRYGKHCSTRSLCSTRSMGLTRLSSRLSPLPSTSLWSMMVSWWDCLLCFGMVHSLRALNN